MMRKSHHCVSGQILWLQEVCFCCLHLSADHQASHLAVLLFCAVQCPATRWEQVAHVRSRALRWSSTPPIQAEMSVWLGLLVVSAAPARYPARHRAATAA